MNRFLVLIFTLILSGSLSAQKEVPRKEEFTTRPFQLSFISPLGTNGMESGRIINQFSINLIAGYAAGLDGVELGGFANLARQHVKGVQMAGFLNFAGGTTEGLQMAGFGNIVSDSFVGSQFAGFTNISKKHQGLQMAGFINVAKETNGSQIAGFLNISKKLKGLQLGVINIVDSVEVGTPVGILSFVRNGYNRLEIWTGETLHLNTGFKFGTAKFYNILAVGAGLHPIAEKSMLGIGYGVGHAFPLTKGQLSLDALSYQLLDTQKPFRFEDGKFNQLTQVKLTYDYPGKQLSYFIGPGFNVLVQQNKQFTEEGWKEYAPYSFYSFTNAHRKVQMWVGGQLGIRF